MTTSFVTREDSIMSTRPFVIALLFIALTGCQRDTSAPREEPAQPSYRPNPSQPNTDRLQVGVPLYTIA
ncbi:MAG: hypothetical protein H0T73_17705 [Ardenticatenales bacterium]|nr:hypothetical protein [Ardenticatenales bacterium]